MTFDYNNCEHKELYFGSGDYYVICSDCGRSWVLTGDYGDEGDSTNCSQANVCGDKRVAFTTFYRLKEDEK